MVHSPRFVVATVISTVGHPFVLLPLTVTLSLAGQMRPAQLFFVGTVYTGSIIVPLIFMIRRKVRRQEWMDSDVSDVRQRWQLYVVTLIVVTLALAVFWLLGFPRPLLLGTIVSLVLLIAGMFINVWSHISMHMMFGGYCAVIACGASLSLSLIASSFLLALAWSRLALGRHTVIQIVSGMVIGAIAGAVLLRLATS